MDEVVGVEGACWSNRYLESDVIIQIGLGKLVKQSNRIPGWITESLKMTNSTTLYERGRSKSTPLWITMLVYNLKAKYGMSDMNFSMMLRLVTINYIIF